MKRTVLATALIIAASLSELVQARSSKPTDIEMEDKIQQIDDNVLECKAGFETKMTLFYPDDQPSKALEQLTREVCLQHTHNLPCKYLFV